MVNLVAVLECGSYGVREMVNLVAVLECGSYGGWEMVNLVAVQIGVTFRIVWVCCT